MPEATESVVDSVLSGASARDDSTLKWRKAASDDRVGNWKAVIDDVEVMANNSADYPYRLNISVRCQQHPRLGEFKQLIMLTLSGAKANQMVDGQTKDALRLVGANIPKGAEVPAVTNEDGAQEIAVMFLAAVGKTVPVRVYERDGFLKCQFGRPEKAKKGAATPKPNGADLKL